MGTRIFLISCLIGCTACVFAETPAGGNGARLIDRVRTRSFRIEAGICSGGGFDTRQIGKNPNNDEYLRISAGGGTGVRFELGYFVEPWLELGLAYLYQTSPLQGQNSPIFSEHSISGGFDRAICLFTPKYVLTAANRGQWKFGLGLGWYGPGEFTYEIKNQTFIFLIPVPPVPVWQQSTEYVYAYDGAVGVHGSAEFEYLLFSRIAGTIGFKYYYTKYHLKSVTGEDGPLTIPDEVRSYMDPMDGSGLDFFFAISCFL
jgi:hypothetical protein